MKIANRKDHTRLEDQIKPAATISCFIMEAMIQMIFRNAKEL